MRCQTNMEMIKFIANCEEIGCYFNQYYGKHLQWLMGLLGLA